jgi:microcystin degradation protein MlrC
VRIAIGGISHETSTFAVAPTTLRDFETGFGLFRGPQILERFRGTNTCTGGFIDGADEQSLQLVPLLWTFAYPGGLIESSAYAALKQEFRQRLLDEQDARGPVDGVLLDLHGAMVVDGVEDGDGDLIQSVRDIVGPACPILVTQDLHANHTQQRVDAADALIGFDTYPHVDMAERGREALRLLVAMNAGRIRPVMAFHPLPLFWGTRCQVTAHSPMDEVIQRVHELEARPGILSVTIATGFPWADVPHVGASAGTSRRCRCARRCSKRPLKTRIPSSWRITPITRAAERPVIPRKSFVHFWNWESKMRCCCISSIRKPPNKRMRPELAGEFRWPWGANPIHARVRPSTCMPK